MAYTTAETNQHVIANQRFTILELLDRLLDKGVVVKGEVLLSVADIDLVYLNLGLLLSSVKTVEEAARKGGKREAQLLARQTSSQAAFWDEPQLQIEERTAAPTSSPAPYSESDDAQYGGGDDAPYSESSDKEVIARMVPATADGERKQFSGPRTNIDPGNVEKGLAQLVLTVVELLRKLMEKQAVRRIDAGQLGAEEIERVGTTFMLLDERMEQLKEVFGLQDEHLNLDLGPLGELL